MAKFIGVIVGIAVLFGIYSLIAWGLSAGISFVFSYDIGFWRTFVGIFVIGTVSNIIFGGIKIRFKEAK